MKIDEFMGIVNRVAYVKRRNMRIDIYSSGNKCYGEWFLSINPYQEDLSIGYDWKYLDLEPNELITVITAVAELKATPIEERCPEKKYRLYVMRNAIGSVPDKCYLGNYGRSANDEHFDYVPREDAWLLTEKQIRNLKSYTPLINCFVEEEVKGDETN